MRETKILVEQQTPQGVLVCDHAGLVINKFSNKSPRVTSLLGASAGVDPFSPTRVKRHPGEARPTARPRQRRAESGPQACARITYASVIGVAMVVKYFERTTYALIVT